VLIIIPPSESKRPAPASGRPVALDELSFPTLTPTRRRIAEALVETSASLDAFDRLRLRPTHARDVARNTRLFELPAMPVLELYTGPLHVGLDAARLSAEAAERAGESLVVVSSLWGALRPRDRVPPYRLIVWSELIGMGRLEPTWRQVLPDVLADAAGDAGVILDLRSPTYQAIGMPAGLGDRTMTLRVDEGRRLGDVIAKRIRGEAAHHLLESGENPADPDALVDVLADRWPVRLDSPERPGRPWTLTLSLD
jgi:cytoplasmic iron level regulating protein YaaA (DUF328/UPF0246 family)